ncbi:MAG: hypothetical protein R6V28_11640 [Nitriliruptoraceae bacterium]
MATNRVLGLLLIGLGGILLLAVTTDIGGEVVVGFAGLAFLGAYATQRTYGLLIPGGILTGLGVGLLLETAGVGGEVAAFGLGAGFVAIAVIDQLVTPGRSAWWWPLIPGGVLLVSSAGSVTGIPDLGRYLLPAVLIVIGAVLLLRQGGDQTPDHDQPATHEQEQEAETTAHTTGRSAPPPPPR